VKLSWLWKIVSCAVIYLIGTVLGGILVGAVGLRLPAAFTSGDAARSFWQAAAATPILVIGLAPLAAGLGGSWWARFGGLFAFNLNSVLELRIFSGVFRNGGEPAVLLQGVLPALVLCGALAWCFRGPATGNPAPHYGAAGWIWRLALGVLAFPLVYFVFGLMVGPIVTPYYNGGGPFGLTIPSPAVIFSTQFVRSTLFLVASLPAILLWGGSRRALIGALGLAHAALVGIYGLAQAGGVMPDILRIAHGLEITVDSFAYAGLLVWLIVPRRASRVDEPAERRLGVPLPG